ncbi:MAG: DUF4332 domain-containing protein [Promethearchaeota archaeon]|nr:MAG: DUF4332 domain-containing protein [Candidatus Lokiarchaeota archaeon]
MNIKDVEAISKKYANLLIKEGYSQIEDLLNLTKSQMSKLAKKTGIPIKMIDTFQELADLMRIDGIGDEIANVLNKIGIDSVKEFAQRNAKNTLERIKEFKKELAGKMPTLNDLNDWIQQATALTLGTTPKKKKSAKKKPSKKPEGDYGPDYWNNKYPKAPIIYTARALRGKDYYKQIDTDVKSFIKNNDAILYHVIDQAQLKKGTFNETALTVQDFVNGFFKYKYDEETADCPEFWQFPFESIQSGIGDCEDGAILIASLLINAGIPSYRVKVAGGGVLPDPIFAPSDTELGGHAWCIYLADRPDIKRGLEWVILDWCYAPDPDVPIEEKPLAKNGGQQGGYKETWFTFNDEYSWAIDLTQIPTGRISNNRTTKKDEIMIKMDDLMRNFAKDQLARVFEKYGLKID